MDRARKLASRGAFFAAAMVMSACDPAPPASSPEPPPPSLSSTASAGAVAAAPPFDAPPEEPVASASTSEPAPEPTASAAAAPPEPVVPEAPALIDDEGELLPQTEDEPSVDSPLFEHRLGLLWKAIVEDDPEIARPFFFPKVAYLKVKAIKDPGRDWERRLWKLFVRDVHEYHGKLGPDPAKATFLRLDFPEGKTTWMKKHREGNAIGYYRVKRPYLVFTDAEGTERKLEITAMISWRGEWHVVHLHGFK